MSFEAQLNEFKEKIRPIILDPDGVHHEFYDGGHGQKLDCENIEDDKELFREWVDITTEGVFQYYYKDMPRFIISVANGTNKLAKNVTRSIKKKLDSESVSTYERITCLQTVKSRRDIPTVQLDQKAQGVISGLHNEYPKGLSNWALVLEDVGTTGRSSLDVIDETVLWANSSIPRFEVLNLWQRSEKLPALLGAGIAYKSLIVEQLDTFSPEDCLELPNGFCHRWRPAIPYGQ